MQCRVGVAWRAKTLDFEVRARPVRDIPLCSLPVLRDSYMRHLSVVDPSADGPIADTKVMRQVLGPEGGRLSRSSWNLRWRSPA